MPHTPRSRALRVQIGLQPLGRQQQPLRARARDRVRFLPALLLELAAGVAQPTLPALDARDDPLRVELELRLGRRLALRLRLVADQLLALELLLGVAEELAPALRRAQLLGQLITPRLAIQLVLGLVGRLVLGEDLLRDLLELQVGIRVRVPRQPSAVDRDQPRLHQPSLIAQPQHLAEQLGKRRLVPTDEPGDRRVIRHHVARDHPIGHVLATVTLDRPRGPHLRRKRVQHQRHHHRRLIRRPAMTVRPVRRIERRQIQVAHSVDHEPRQMIRRQPIPHIRRQQESLLTTALNEVLRHTGILLNVPDGTPLCDNLPGLRQRALRPVCWLGHPQLT